MAPLVTDKFGEMKTNDSVELLFFFSSNSLSFHMVICKQKFFSWFTLALSLSLFADDRPGARCASKRMRYVASVFIANS